MNISIKKGCSALLAALTLFTSATSFSDRYADAAAKTSAVSTPYSGADLTLFSSNVDAIVISSIISVEYPIFILSFFI